MSSRVRLCALLPALLLLGCPEPEPSTHAGIRLELQRAAAQNEDPFPGTRTAVVVVSYTDCLIDFYTMSNPDYAQDGVKGGKVFDDWAAKLCDPGEFDNGGPMIECEIEGFDQIIDTVEVRYRLTITYTIIDDDMTNKELRVGPIPRENLTESCLPTVNLESVTGDDANGAQIWHQNSFQDGSNASSEQNGSMKALIIRD